MENVFKIIVFIYAAFGLILSLSRLIAGNDSQHDLIRYFNIAFYILLLANIFEPRLFSQNKTFVLIFICLGLCLNLAWIFGIFKK
jgi:hypothetical protein